jgi:5S rRNA maturation endonuclease (ribonuclease M5)
VNLDAKFTTDPKAMSPKASAYFRRRPFLSLEVCQSFRVGYLPRDAGDDKSGGTLRGLIVYPYLDDSGDVLCWFGRDPAYEDKHQAWLASNREGKEPEKFHFVKGFLRGQELWGQDRLKEEANQAIMKQLGLILVEGPNDVVRLHSLGVPAVALCSNHVTEAQAQKTARRAQQFGNGILSLMLDNDEAGDTGMKQALPMLARCAPVQLVWSRDMHEGRFKDRQPEILTLEEWSMVTSSTLPFWS